MQTKLQNWVINNLVTEGWNLSYSNLDEYQLDRLIELAQEAKKDLHETEDSLMTSWWSEVDWELDEEEV